MQHIFRILIILLILNPALSMADMAQIDIDELYKKPIILDNKHYTFDIGLPVDSTDGYRWFLVPPDYDYIDDSGYEHDSVDIEHSKWGGMDNFKLKLTKKFRKIPHKIVLHFECFRPFEKNPQILKKDIVILSILD